MLWMEKRRKKRLEDEKVCSNPLKKLGFQNQRNAESFDFFWRIQTKHLVQPIETVARIVFAFWKGKDIRESVASHLKECQCRVGSSHRNGFIEMVSIPFSVYGSVSSFCLEAAMFLRLIQWYIWKSISSTWCYWLLNWPNAGLKGTDGTHWSFMFYLLDLHVATENIEFHHPFAFKDLASPTSEDWVSNFVDGWCMMDVFCLFGWWISRRKTRHNHHHLLYIYIIIYIYICIPL